MSEGDKIIAAALITMGTVVLAVLKQSAILEQMLNKIGESIALRIDKSSKWECKYRPPENQPNGSQKPS